MYFTFANKNTSTCRPFDLMVNGKSISVAFVRPFDLSNNDDFKQAQGSNGRRRKKNLTLKMLFIICLHINIE